MRRGKRRLGVAVALLAEGVDRNVSIAAVVLDDWLVALLAEGVDRNCTGNVLEL